MPNSAAASGATSAQPSPKLQRWTDLLVALLHHRAGLPFDDLAREVPAYGRALAAPGANPDSVKRTFERDKAELKELGVPIETIGDEGDEDTRYRVRSTDFYLPYLAMATPRGVAAPAKVHRYGYHSLETLAFTPEELLAIADAVARARQLGDPALRADVDSAMRKLAFDLPLDGVVAQDEAHLVPPRAAADPAVLEQLGHALLHRKRVRITYRAMETDQESERHVEPWGLFWANGHWYLAARDTARDALRNYRVNRVSAVRPENTRVAAADYEIPGTFNLREHARTRQPWELGEGDAIEATVELRHDTGAVRAAAALGTVVEAVAEGARERRRYAVRRPDAFARWLLSFAGGLVPVSPVGLVEEYRRQLAATVAVYAGDSLAEQRA
jgi:predicted DNA-binding transcriptional regulator YafY